MAGATQPRSRGSTVKTPSVSSDDGTLAATPSDNTAADAANERPPHGRSQHDVPAHDEIAPLGVNVIEALRIVSRLEQLGLDKQEISLPKCIVLGQQSTGKSSVIEAISGIKTPRDTGTCTRCPLFIELQPSPDPRSGWHAAIYLLRHYDVHTDLQGADAEFPGWVANPTPVKTAFAQTDKPEELEHLIRCAQRATLSPFEKPESFLEPTFDDREIHKTLFSPNIVCIVVSKPGLPPLSFYDLPGMIGQAETEEEAYTVPLVENLVTKYIQDPEALVLLTCALENDIANSIAAGLARKLKVTDRCMGVLTKPDRLPQGSSSDDLANILEGRRFQLGHKYFVVKNLNSDEIKQGLTHRDARRLEQTFFSTIAPWSTSLRAYRPRFGTINMQQYLSQQLGNQVMLKLPVIYRQIETRLAAVEEELSRIPDTPLHTATRTVADVVQSFSVDVRSEMAGDHGHVSWSNTWKSLQKDLWDALSRMKPTMSTRGELDKGLFASTLPGQSIDDSIVIDSDDDVQMPHIPETPSKKRKHETPTKREAQTPAPAPSPFRTPKRPGSKTSRVLFSNTSSSSQHSDVVKLEKPFKLDDVRRYISQNSSSRVPGQINHQVREALMLLPLENWRVIINGFFEGLENRLKSHVRSLFDKHFRAWKGSELYIASWTIVETIMNTNLYEQQTTMAAESLDDELEGPHIFHKDVFEAEQDAVMGKYKQARLEARFKVFVAEAAAHQDRELSTADKEKIRKDDRKMAVIRDEPYPKEIELIAHITSYYMVSSRRFHDSIIMRIESKFFKQLRDKLRDQLQDELGIYDEHQGPQNAQRLLAESPDRLARRNILVAQRKTLLEGLQCFKEHYQKFQAESAVEPAQAGRSNYNPPSAEDDMEGVHSHGLPLR